MRILHLIPSFAGGGAERQLAYTAGALSDLAVDTHVGYVHGGPNLTFLEKKPVTMHQISAVGNHDPFIGPASVWNRPSFQIAPKSVRVFRSVEFVELESGFILASPLLQKKSTIDPSLKLVELAKQLPSKLPSVALIWRAQAR